MTNRDYLKTLSNEELAELLERSNICNYLIDTCPHSICNKCLTDWLGAERKPKKEIDKK